MPILDCPNLESCPDKTDEELVAFVKEKKDCYVCLMERYEDKMMRYIRRISGVDTETAEDIIQEVFLKVYMNLNSFNPELKFSSWLYRIAHNETINHWRRNKKKTQGNISWDDNEALKNIIKDDYNTEEAVYQKITNEHLLRAIEAVEEKYRNVLVLNYLEGKSYREIADILKKPIGTVGTLLNRAKKSLRDKLTDQGIDSKVAMRD